MGFPGTVTVIDREQNDNKVWFEIKYKRYTIKANAPALVSVSKLTEIAFGFPSHRFFFIFYSFTYTLASPI